MRFPIAAGFCILMTTLSMQADTPNDNANLRLPWNWSGVIGTGQSLAVGQGGNPVLSTNQVYGNLKLSTAHLPWPIDPDNTNLAIVPLVEPIGRASQSYPSSWPENIAGETPHTAMANQISVLVRTASRRDFVGVHSEVGENGQCMIHLRKNPVREGVSGRSYEAALIETKAITRLAKGAGKTFGVGAITVTHGECDAGNTSYASDLYQLWLDYNTDLTAITGQKEKILMIVSQQNSISNRAASTLAQWKVGVDHPADIVCSGPKYQYPTYEGIHLTTRGYQQLGEKYGQIYFERAVCGRDWQPLQPIDQKRDGELITVRFHVPVPPLKWDEALPPPHPSVDEWKEGKGFEITRADGAKVTIKSVSISGDSVVIACGSDPGPAARVSYAMIGERKPMATPFKGTFRWGLLRDSDPFIGSSTGKAQPNYGIAFEITVP
jgi:hypothetical protein